MAVAVSIIIINYNSGDRLVQVLTALQNQSFTDFDVILFDNASSDGSPATKLPQNLRTQWVFSETNLGFAGGVMAALPHAAGEWVVFLNPDAYPEPEWLARLWAGTHRYGPSTILGSVQLQAEDREILDGLGDAYHISGTAWRGGFGKSVTLRPDEDREIFAACFAASMAHRETFFDHGGLDTDYFCYHEDVDFGFRHRLLGGRAVLVHDAVVHHEGSGITGRYSDFTVFHGIRNRQWTFLTNMPALFLPIAIPMYVGFSLAFLVRSFMLGIGKPYCRGWWAGMKGMRAAWRKRRQLQPRRQARLIDIARALRWSPIAPLRRAPDLFRIPLPRPDQAASSTPQPPEETQLSSKLPQ